LLPAETALVTGAYRIERLASGEREVFNAVYVIGEDGAILDAYDKVHLVPFGEYLPLPDLLEKIGLRQLVGAGFSPGPRRQVLRAPFGPSFLPLICYEVIFSGDLLGEGERPHFLLNLTNDGWFGRTIGPRQHFHQARVRSVEEGLPLLRAANTGISAIIDAYGRIVAISELGEPATIEARLPAALEAPPFYAQWRHVSVMLLLGVSLLIAGSRIVYPVRKA
jgi:apolipoprotein N-acyltransferase